jgi:hypothetical protein
MRRMLLATIASALVYGAVAAEESGVATGVAVAQPGTSRGHPPSVESGSASRDTSKPEVRGTGSEVAREPSSVRSGRQGGALHPAAGLPQRASALPSALTARPRRRASAPMGADALHSKRQADHPAGGRDAVAGTAGGAGAALSLVQRRQSAPPPAAASRLGRTLHAQAGAAVIGGARVSGSGSLGGPVSSRTVIKGSIDGSALHRRL